MTPFSVFAASTSADQASPPSVAGMQGSFSYAQGGNMGYSVPFVGGQMGMSFGFNRDFGVPAGVGPAVATLPGLGVADEMVRRDFADSAFWSATIRTDATGNATGNATGGLFGLPWITVGAAGAGILAVGTGVAMLILRRRKAGSEEEEDEEEDEG